MGKRKPISKKLRFEIFKRDKFTCQYCGKMAPDVVLEVDHIKPVCKGGTNDELNLITSCFECNRGKGKRKISENATIKKQQEQLQLLAERREQLELLIEWKNGLLNIDSQVADKLIENLSSRYDVKDEDELFDTISDCIRKYTSRVVIEACYDYNKDFLSLKEFEKACFYKKSDLDNPSIKDVNYIVKILYNRNIIYLNEKRSIFIQINNIARQLYGTERYKKFIMNLTYKASTCNDLLEFKKELEIKENEEC